jgi:hypothetical protein
VESGDSNARLSSAWQCSSDSDCTATFFKFQFRKRDGNDWLRYTGAAEGFGTVISPKTVILTKLWHACPSDSCHGLVANKSRFNWALKQTCYRFMISATRSEGSLMWTAVLGLFHIALILTKSRREVWARRICLYALVQHSWPSYSNEPSNHSGNLATRRILVLKHWDVSHLSSAVPVSRYLGHDACRLVRSGVFVQVPVRKLQW